jgi:transcriptional regulator with XRE-family HTH domain
MDLAKYIDEKNINKSELCKILNVTRSTLYVWLNDKDNENHTKIVDAIQQIANNYVKGLDNNVGLNINTMKGNSRNEVNYNNNTGNSEGIEKLNQEIEMLKKENELLKKYKELADNEKDFRDRERELYLDKIDSLTKQIKVLKGD